MTTELLLIAAERAKIGKEIVRLHDFFQDWFNDEGNRSIDEFADALDAAFFIVSPLGTVSDRKAIVAMVANSRGRGPVGIRIENIELRRSDGSGLHVATYEEHQQRPDESAAMISTVGLAVDVARPGGYRWIFVHETWLREPESSG